MLNGHNDGLMLVFMLLAVLFLLLERDAPALLCGFMAAMVKHSGIFLLACTLVYLIRRGRWSGAIQGSLVAAVIGVVVWVLLFQETNAIGALANSHQAINVNTIQGLLFYSPSVSASRAFYQSSAMVPFRVVLTVLFGAFCLWRLTRIRSFDTLVTNSGYMTLAFIAGYSALMQPWWLLWLLPIAAITRCQSLRTVLIGWSFTIVALYAFPPALARESAVNVAIRLLLAHGILLGLFLQNGHLVRRTWVMKARRG